jgi:hypothetical protein
MSIEQKIKEISPQIKGVETDVDKAHKKHIARVNELIEFFIQELKFRAVNHDSDKLVSPNREYYHIVSRDLKGLTYGSSEYFECLKELKPALDNHFKIHRHHPEHFENLIDGMNLVDLVEMFLDWKAASERHADGCIDDSIKFNKTRFKISDQLENIFKNTVKDYFNDAK